MRDKQKINGLLDILGTHPFRAKFRLGEKERIILREKRITTIRQHARDLLKTRLFCTKPINDGKQTPYRGHPVFVAQHATATCCRSCLAKCHKIPKNRELTTAEQDYVLKVIEHWLLRQPNT